MLGVCMFQLGGLCKSVLGVCVEGCGGCVYRFVSGGGVVVEWVVFSGT